MVISYDWDLFGSNIFSRMQKTFPYPYLHFERKLSYDSLVFAEHYAPQNTSKNSSFYLNRLWDCEDLEDFECLDL